MLTIIVSGTNKLRDDLRSLVRDHLNDKVRLYELEYQPSED